MQFLLFDIDGTITECGQPINPETYKWLINEVKSKTVTVGLVTGSPLPEIKRQLGESVLQDFEFVFTENGNVSYNGTELIGSRNLQDYLGEDKLQKLINFCLEYMSMLWLPCKRGTFIDFRTSMINISPVGRSSNLEERIAFAEYDEIHKIRENFISALKIKFPDYKLKYSIGGHVGFDLMPIGWDKTTCLQYICASKYSELHFFGDKVQPGGNDYEICNHGRVIGHGVSGVEHMKEIVNQILSAKNDSIQKLLPFVIE